MRAHHERGSDHGRTIRHKSVKEKAANKIDGIVALAMASLEAVWEGSEPFVALWAV